MNIRKLIEKRIRHSRDGVDVVADVNAAVSANVGERNSHTSVSSRQHVVQRSPGTAGTRKGADGG